jgi:hypothetical protein
MGIVPLDDLHVSMSIFDVAHLVSVNSTHNPQGVGVPISAAAPVIVTARVPPRAGDSDP